MKRYEIRIAGFGGLGILTTGKIVVLASANRLSNLGLPSKEVLRPGGHYLQGNGACIESAIFAS